MSMMSENPMIMEEKAENIGTGWNRKFAQGSVISSTSTNARKSRSIAQRKEPEREFFEMTVLAFILTHPSSKNIMTLDRNKLFDECHKVHKSFQEWPNWINATLTRIVLNEKYNKV